MNILEKSKIITDSKGRATDVIIDIKTAKKIQDDLEELYLIKEYDKAIKKNKLEHAKGEYLRWDDFLKKQGFNK